LLGSQIFGIAGMIIAVPIASILKILIQEIYARIYDHSTDESEAPREVHSIF
jgi:predicted PurR-regulated permease PerM